MARIVHVLLLIASLLACPYRCLATFGGAPADTPDVRSCACCADPVQLPAEQEKWSDADPREQQSSAPNVPCQCGSCLCRGAVLPDDEPLYDALTRTGDVELLLQISCEPDATVATGWSTGPPGVASAAGRPLRVLLHSLQI